MSNNADFMKQVVKELRKAENWFYTERQYCSKSGWNTYAAAKNNHRWFASYTGRVAGLKPEDYPDRESFFDAMAKIIDAILVDHDYPEPRGAKGRAKSIIEKFRNEPEQ